VQSLSFGPNYKAAYCLNHKEPWFGARSMTHRYSSSSWASAIFAISTRYAMLAPQPVEHPPRWLGTAGLYIGQPSLKALDGFDATQKLLVGFRVLHDELCPSVDREDQRIAGLPETVEQIYCVSLEVAERSDVVCQIEHERNLIKFASNLMIPRQRLTVNPFRQIVPTIVPETRQNNASRANGRQIV